MTIRQETPTPNIGGELPCGGKCWETKWGDLKKMFAPGPIRADLPQKRLILFGRADKTTRHSGQNLFGFQPTQDEIRVQFCSDSQVISPPYSRDLLRAAGLKPPPPHVVGLRQTGVPFHYRQRGRQWLAQNKTYEQQIHRGRQPLAHGGVNVRPGLRQDETRDHKGFVIERLVR